MYTSQLTDRGELEEWFGGGGSIAVETLPTDLTKLNAVTRAIISRFDAFSS